MSYLRVECHICGAIWNYYEETLHYPPLLTTQVDIQGCVCPCCGCISSCATYASVATKGGKRPDGTT